MDDLDESFESMFLDSDEDAEDGGEVDIPVLPIRDNKEENAEDEEEGKKEKEEDNVWSSVIIPHNHISFTGWLWCER